MSQTSGATIDTAHAGPVQGKERFSSIDVVRGVALFGILLMNIIVFGHGMGTEEFLVEDYVYDTNFWAWVIERTYFEGTQRTLFSLLFGAGVIILTSRAEARGAGLMTADIYYRRNLWLVAFGMIDAYLLLWDGDILFFYGIVALFLFPLRNVKARNLLIAGLVCIAVLVAERLYDASELRQMHADAEVALAVQHAGGELSEEQQEAIEEWQGVEAEFQYDEEFRQEQLDEHRGSYADTFMGHLPWLTHFHGDIFYRWIFLDVLAVMLIGMALMKWGVLTLKRPPRFYWLMMLFGYGIALPINIWETHTLVMNDFSALARAQQALTYDLGRLTMATGHLAAVLLFVRSGWIPALQNRLAAVGRMALTNYIMHSVLCGIIFLGVGFGMYGVFERHELYYIVLAICLFQLLVSYRWLQFFRFGPLEWLWRSLTYLKKQPMRKNTDTSGRADWSLPRVWAWIKAHW